MPVIIISVIAVVAAAITIPISVTSSFEHNVSYECLGVDDGWLNDHPLNVSNLPTKVKHFDRVNLGEPEIEGYTFEGWYLKGNEPKLVKNNKAIFGDLGYVKDVSFYAKFEINVFNVTLDLDGGVLTNLDEKDSFDGHTYNISNGVASTTYTCLDEPFTYPSSRREGYDFDNQGWLDKERSQYYMGCDTSLYRDVNLTANWTIHPYTISYTFTGEGVDEFASGIINNNEASFDYEKEIILNDPYLKGYTFQGWYDASGNVVTEIPVHTSPENDNVALEGRFTPEVYTISYYDESNSDHSALPTSYKRCSPDIAIPAINPIGYTFRGWISSNVTTFTYTDTIPHGSTGDITFTADVELITYSASFRVMGVLEQYEDDFNLKDRVIPFTIKSDKIALPNNPSVPGYDFVGYFDQSGHEVTNIPAGSIGDRVITARFTPTVYQITLVNTRGNTRTIDYTIESTLSFDDPSSIGYTFEGWKDDNGQKVTSISVGDALNRRSFTLTSDWILNTYSIEYSFEGLHEGAQVINDNVVTYNYETDVTLADLSVDGYNFKGWYDESGNKVTSIDKHTTVGNKSFTARFEAIQYTVSRSYKVNGTGNKETVIVPYYVYSEEFTLPDVASTVRKFVGWQDTVTKRMYYSGHKFGGGEMANYSLEAIWSYIGEGTDEDPYQIFDLEQLLNIDEMDKSYILMNDITISSNSDEIWVPIGTSRSKFTGHFNGNGKTINLIVAADSANNDEFSNYFGLFGYLGNTAYVHDFNIIGSIGTSSNRLPSNLFGLVAAQNEGVIENIYCNVPIYLTSFSTGEINIGGIVGKNISGTIIDCSYGVRTIDVSAPNTKTLLLGGIAGYGSGGEIRYCSSSSTIVGASKTNCYVGGILGDRDLTQSTRISWDQDPSVVNPVDGSVSASVTDAYGKVGMSQFNNKCVVGKPIVDDNPMTPSTSGLVEGDYYYVFATATQGSTTLYVMYWVECLGNGQWSTDYKNVISYRKTDVI